MTQTYTLADLENTARFVAETQGKIERTARNSEPWWRLVKLIDKANTDLIDIRKSLGSELEKKRAFGKTRIAMPALYVFCMKHSKPGNPNAALQKEFAGGIMVICRECIKDGYELRGEMRAQMAEDLKNVEGGKTDGRPEGRDETAGAADGAREGGSSGEADRGGNQSAELPVQLPRAEA